MEYRDHGIPDDAMLPDDVDELRQLPPTLPAIAVKIEGPQLGHELPARVAYSRTLNVTNSADPALLEQIAAGDPRVKYVTIIAATNPVFVGHDKQNVVDGICGLLPVGVPLTLPTSAPIWVRSNNAAGSQVSWWIGQWAD